MSSIYTFLDSWGKQIAQLPEDKREEALLRAPEEHRSTIRMIVDKWLKAA